MSKRNIFDWVHHKQIHRVTGIGPLRTEEERMQRHAHFSAFNPKGGWRMHKDEGNGKRGARKRARAEEAREAERARQRKVAQDLLVDFAKYGLSEEDAVRPFGSLTVENLYDDAEGIQPKP